MVTRLKYARVMSGKTTRKSSDAAGVTQAALWSWEAGNTEPLLSQAVALARFYGCALDDLVGDVPPGTTIPVELLGRTRSRRSTELPQAGEG